MADGHELDGCEVESAGKDLDPKDDVQPMADGVDAPAPDPDPESSSSARDTAGGAVASGSDTASSVDDAPKAGEAGEAGDAPDAPEAGEAGDVPDAPDAPDDGDAHGSADGSGNSDRVPATAATAAAVDAVASTALVDAQTPAAQEPSDADAKSLQDDACVADAPEAPAAHAAAVTRLEIDDAAGEACYAKDAAGDDCSDDIAAAGSGDTASPDAASSAGLASSMAVPASGAAVSASSPSSASPTDGASSESVAIEDADLIAEEVPGPYTNRARGIVSSSYQTASAEMKVPKQLDFSFTQNRELSWLNFDKRVLQEALDPNVPVYERLKFIAIFESNLDEFFMVRVGSITDVALIAPDDRENKSNMTAQEQLDAIFSAVRPLVSLRDKVYRKTMKALKPYGIEELDLDALSKKERKFARDYYREFIRPILSPQVIDARHPFPHLKNKALYIAAILIGEDGEQHMGIVPVPENLPPAICDPDAPLHYVAIEQVVAHNIKKLFGIYKVESPCVISVTRNADISFDEEKFADDEGDYRLHMSRLLKKRNRLNPVRLEVQGSIDKNLRNMLLERLKLSKEQLFITEAPISLQGVYSFEKKFAPGLKAQLCYPPFSPRASKSIDTSGSIIAQVRERDRILFYPYDSMDPFLRLLSEAAHDDRVISIKITLYRLASDSRVAAYLAEAAEMGKDVTVLMELRARFDEANNIDWSEHLEEAGCNIIYGMENYKCHSKICLITMRDESGKLVKLTQIGTGNYNEKTARLYTDLCLFTADEGIGQDAVEFFQNMLIGNLRGSYTKLLVAPCTMKRTIMAGIDREIAKGEQGRITIKCNSVTERDIIDKLSEASCAGVKIRMNVRGICCLLPGIEGKTENIRIRSIVGQFLEHSRIYCFGEGDDMEMYISSADLMTRNLVHRVEVACPIDDPCIREAIWTFLEKIFADNVKARAMQPDGTLALIGGKKDVTGGEESEPFCMQDWCVEHPLQIQPPEKKEARDSRDSQEAQEAQESQEARDSQDSSKVSQKKHQLSHPDEKQVQESSQKTHKSFFARLFGWN